MGVWGNVIIPILQNNFVTGIDFSDHASFWRYGYKAVIITDTAFYRNPNYHSPTDLPHALHYQELAQVVKEFYDVILDIAGSSTFRFKKMNNNKN